MDKTNSEFNSFVWKFHQLWQAGAAARLHAECHAGMAWLGLQVQLGRAPAPVHRGHREQHQPGLRRRSPAQLRRKARRAADRDAAVKAAEAAMEKAAENADDDKKDAEEAAMAEREAEEAAKAKKEAEEAAKAEKEAEEAANAAAAARIRDAVLAVGIGVAAVAKRVAENAAAKKKKAEEEEDDNIISSDEEEGSGEEPFNIQREMVEKETDNMLRHAWTYGWTRGEDGRLVKRPGLANEVVSNTELRRFPLREGLFFSPSQKKKLRNIVRKRARTALSSDSSPTLPAYKFRK